MLPIKCYQELFEQLVENDLIKSHEISFDLIDNFYIWSVIYPAGEFKIWC